MEDLIKRVEDALDQIRPYLKADGGDVSLLGISEDKIAKLELLGACRSCSMNLMTLESGIEETIRREVPEIKGIETINIKSTKV